MAQNIPHNPAVEYLSYHVIFPDHVEVFFSFPAAKARVLAAIVAGEARPTMRAHRNNLGPETPTPVRTRARILSP